MSDQRISKLQDILLELSELAGEQERTRIIPNSVVINATPTELPSNYIIVQDDNGYYVPAVKLPGVTYADNDKVNLLIVKGTEPIALNHGSASAGGTVDTGVILPSTFDARLTTSSSDPITTTDQTAITTLHLLPYKGRNVSLYDGSAEWEDFELASAGISLSLSGLTTNTNYDVFVYDSSGLTLESVAWTNDTTRATALVDQDGVKVKSGATARRYVGTFRITGTTGQTEDSESKRFVWNLYNQQRRIMTFTESTASWTYTTNTWRPWNNDTANRVEFVLGLSRPVRLEFVGTAYQSGVVWFGLGIGLDSTSADSSDVNPAGFAQVEGANPQMAIYEDFPGIGYHYLQGLEISQAAGTTTWYGTGGSGWSARGGGVGHILG